MADSLDTEIESIYSENDRFKFPSGVWFVRSKRITPSDVKDDIGITVGERGAWLSLF